MEKDKRDVGFIDDALDLISDLSCAESHCARTAMQLKDDEFIELLTMFRRDRSKLLYELISENSGESYCLLKHLSKVSRNWEELGNRMLERKDLETAKEYLEKALIYKNVCKLIIEKGGKK